MTGPHHSIICFLTSSGHGAAEWTTTSRLETSYLSFDLLGQAEEADELGRHHVGRRDAVPLDGGQRLLGVELAQDGEGLADVQRAEIEALAAAVVHAGRHQVHPGEGLELEGMAEALQPRRRPPRGRSSAAGRTTALGCPVVPEE